MIRIKNLQVNLQDRSSIEELIARRLGLAPCDISRVLILRKAIDARRYKGAPIRFLYMADVEIKGSEKALLKKFRRDANVTAAESTQRKLPVITPKPAGDNPPVVVGFGPAGMFAALTLAKYGWCPLVLERGKDVDSRHRDIQTFWQGGAFQENSNVQFGEGGAGTFSDGKLTTRVNAPLMGEILAAFVEAGAPEEIKYLHKPHIGTDLLRTVVKNIREKIISLGGQVRFASQVTDIKLDAAGNVQGVIVNGEEVIKTNALFMGIGHSARDTYAMLQGKGMAMEAKPFAMGVRIEHPQEMLDEGQYGEDAGNPLLPVSDYALTYNNKATGRGAYSFCMCPGGQVVAAASEQGGVVTNGMSCYKRDSGIANSALLVTVKTSDFANHVLGGIEFQRKWERLAFQLGGSNYFAPVQTVGDFLQGKSGSEDFLTVPSYQPGFKSVDLRQCLPGFVTEMLSEALPYWDRKISGFAHKGAVLTGVETRSSAPCRLLRSRESYESLNMPGLYPMGEGAGYAGGIMSAAADGMNCALAFLQKNRHN